MVVLLALAGAVSYGLSDFLGGLASRRTSPWSVAFLASLTGAVAVLVASGPGGAPASGDLWWGAIAGVGNGFGTAFLYRGLSRGRMGVIGPISAVGAAVVPVAVGVLTGERPGALVWIGVAAALPGIWLVTREPDLPGPAPRPDGTGVLDGVLAGLGFGSLFAALGQVPDSAGLLPLAVNQLVASVMIAGVAAALREPWVPRERIALTGLACGVLGAAATVGFLLATQLGQLTVSAVLASLYPAFTILLASLVLREPIHRLQGVGLLLCAIAVTLVAAG